MTSSPQLSGMAAEWRDAKVLYPAYIALAREFVLDIPACADLDANADAPGEEGIQQARQWFDRMDGQIQVHQLRHFLQTTPLADEMLLRSLLLRHLQRPQHTASDRDKVDFLLVQYFSHIAPQRLDDTECDLEYVAQALQPVVGAVNFSIPDWLAPLEQIIEAAVACRRLRDMFSGRILEEGRKVKANAGSAYFMPIALVAFTRFNFLIRRIFFRLMHDDLNAIYDGLHDLERRGVRTLDCRRAHFSHQEATERLRLICHSWKVMFQAEYSTGQPLKMLTDLRAVIDEALARTKTAARPSRETQSPPAGPKIPSARQAPEFHITGPQHTVNED
jgi:hypothetical protein